MHTNFFDHWDKIESIALEDMDRQIYTGENVMLVRNTIHPNVTTASHNHPHEQILYIESGECDVISEKGTQHMTAGGLAWMPSGMQHHVVNTQDTPLIVVDIFSPIREDFLK